MNLDKIFKPQTIAVIGASDEKGRVGYDLFSNLKDSKFAGRVYPINIKRDNVQDVKAYPNIAACPAKVDLAIIVTPASTVLGIVEECGKAGVGGIVIISAGFMEVGHDGENLAKQILAMGKKYKMRIIGPNCLGFLVPALNLNASFAAQSAWPGNIAFISQSGALCTAVLDWSSANNVGFSYFVSIGSMIDVGFHDLIEYFGKDPGTDGILLYMESLTEAPKFLTAARKLARKKPVLAIKAGRSSSGAKAAKSHTGSLAGDDAIFDAAFASAGIVRVDTINELFNAAMAIAMQPQAKGGRLTVVTNAGGPGVITADALMRADGELTDLDHKTLARLDEILPAAWSHGNPVDILGDADPVRYAQALKICLEDKNTDAVLAILTPQSMTDPTAVAKELVKLHGQIKKKKDNKMILTAWMGGAVVEAGKKILTAGGIPTFAAPEDAVLAYRNATAFSKTAASTAKPKSQPVFKFNTEANRKLILNARQENRTALTEAEAKTMLANYGIPVVKHAIAQSADEAGRLAAKIGLPLAMKILSPDIIHKTDIGGVKLGVASVAEASKAYEAIIRNAKKNCPQADIQGVFMEAMVNKRFELLIGSKKDPIFGPAIVFGQGGTAVEVMKDTAIALSPLDMAGALRLIERTKIARLLQGYRNLPGADMNALSELLCQFSQLLADFPEIKELDINPFAVDEKGGVVLDAKIILE